MSRDHVLERTQVVPVPIEEAFAFFADARNLEQITPPWLLFRIVEAPGRIFLGPLGSLVRRLLVRGWVEGIFDYRAETVVGLLRAAPASQPRRTA